LAQRTAAYSTKNSRSLPVDLPKSKMETCKFVNKEINAYKSGKKQKIKKKRMFGKSANTCADTVLCADKI
jgi:hypothetical protein